MPNPDIRLSNENLFGAGDKSLHDLLLAPGQRVTTLAATCCGAARDTSRRPLQHVSFSRESRISVREYARLRKSQNFVSLIVKRLTPCCAPSLPERRPETGIFAPFRIGATHTLDARFYRNAYIEPVRRSRNSSSLLMLFFRSD
jgi:hypothetical protein